MRRSSWFRPGRDEPVPAVWQLSPDQHRQVLDLLSEIGLGIVREARGPVPLLTFGRRVLDHLGGAHTGHMPLPHFADALKRVIRDMGHERLRVMSPTEFLGVGYIYNHEDRDTWPVQSSR